MCEIYEGLDAYIVKFRILHEHLLVHVYLKVEGSECFVSF